MPHIISGLHAAADEAQSCNMVADNSQITASGRRRGLGRPFPRGVSGNPGGRPRAVLDVQELARAHTPDAIRALVAALDSPRERVAAACALLDRAWGRPAQPLAADRDGGKVEIEFRWRNEGEEPKPEPMLTIDSSSVSECAEGADADAEVDIQWAR